MRAEEEIAQRKKGAEKLRNTPNYLIAGSNRNLIQAQRLEYEAAALDQQLQDAQSAAERSLAKAFEGTVKVAEDLEKDKAHTEAYCLLSATKSLQKQIATVHPSLAEFRYTIPSYRLDSNKRIAEGTRTALHAARSALGEKRLYAAEEIILLALQKEQGSHLLKRMQEEVRARIVHFEQQVLEVDARKKSRKHGEALALLAEVRVGCADSTAAESLEKELKTIIAEQDNSLEKAKIFEREGEYEKAIKIHDIYSDPSTISGLLEKYGNQREGKGDFVGAAAAYEKANRKNLALSLKEKVNTQINEYKRAEKMSSNGEYDQAAEIYKKYADEEKLSGIELKKNRGGTESGNLLDWLRDFEARRGKLGKTDDIFSELAEAAGEALRGSVEAGHYVGCMMTMNGKQMQNKKMFEGGLMFLEKAALKGHALSACELGIALVKGYSGDTAWDEKKGKEWLRKSADEGIQKAREELIRLEKSNTKKAAKSASTKNSESDESYISEEIRKWRNGGREKAIQQAIRDFKSHPNTAVVNESLIIEMVDGNFQKTLQMMRAMGPSNFRKEFGSSPEP
jgi:hypothetical protein